MPILHDGHTCFIEHSADGRSWTTSYVLGIGPGPLQPSSRTKVNLGNLPESEFIRIRHSQNRQVQCITHAVQIIGATPASIGLPEYSPDPLLVHVRP